MTQSPYLGQAGPSGPATGDSKRQPGGDGFGDVRLNDPNSTNQIPTGALAAPPATSATGATRRVPAPGGTASAGPAVPSGAPAASAPRSATRTSGPRRARLQLRHINPWTVLKFSCVLSIALFFVWLITIGILYGVLDAAGIVGKVNDTAQTINGSGSKAPLSPGVVFGGAALIGAVNIVLFIALSTVGSIIYNLCADLVGGVELTLSERE